MRMSAHLVEGTNAEAYVKHRDSNDSNDEYAGLQFTHKSYKNFSGQATMNKSSTKLIGYLKHGFAVVCAILSDGLVCGAYLWLPERDLGFFKQKYSLDELKNMVTADQMKEQLYFKQLLNLVDFGFDRFTGTSGDLLIGVGGAEQAMAEVRLAQSASAASTSFSVKVRRVAQLPIDANNLPDFVMVVTATSESSEHDKTSDQETYKFFILIPTRTEDGTVNIRFDDQFARSLSFRFDRDTLEFSTNGQVKDSCALVLQSGLGGRRFDAAAAAVVRGCPVDAAQGGGHGGHQEVVGRDSAGR